MNYLNATDTRDAIGMGPTATLASFAKMLVEFERAPSRRSFIGIVSSAALVCLLPKGMVEMVPVDVTTPSCTIEYPPADLNDCPNKGHHPEHTPTSNGCGPAGSENYPIPQGYGPARFTDACNAHDICYGTCNTEKAVCDSNFGNGIKAACAAKLPGVFNTLDRAKCMTIALAYQQLVVRGGQKAFDDAQKEDCECCRPAIIYCPCNTTCYPDEESCQAACHVGLGCFANICGPDSGKCVP